MEKVICKGCGKTAEEHFEARSMAKIESEVEEREITPSQWVRENERLTPDGKYYDTGCYIKAGMPL